jgi:hypothetical protein
MTTARRIYGSGVCAIERPKNGPMYYFVIAIRGPAPPPQY